LVYIFPFRYVVPRKIWQPCFSRQNWLVFKRKVSKVYFRNCIKLVCFKDKIIFFCWKKRHSFYSFWCAIRKPVAKKAITEANSFDCSLWQAEDLWLYFEPFDCDIRALFNGKC
jgi:hypothetical protein